MTRHVLSTALMLLIACPVMKAEDESADPGRLRLAQPLRSDRPSVSLDGAWSFQIDPGGAGATGQWHTGSALFTNTVRIPGCPEAQGFTSKGDGWYRRSVEVPEAWTKRGRIWLHLGGVKPAVDVWMNGRRVGASVSSRVPLKADVTECVTPGGGNVLTVRVFNPEVKLHGVWDYMDGRGLAWNGMYRSVFLEWTADPWIEEVRVDPDPAAGRVGVEVTVGRQGAAADGLEVRCEVTGTPDGAAAGSAAAALAAFVEDRARGEAAVPVAKPKLWSPADPALYRLAVSLRDGATVVDAVSLRFGFRTITREGTTLLLNGTPIFLRGGCDDQVYVDTLCPAASKEFYLRRLKLAKAYGFNYTKSCVELFVPEFLDAADEVGYLVCQEMPFGISAEYFGKKKVDYRAARMDPPDEFARLYARELEHVVRSDRHHPSVAIYSMASELGISGVSTQSFRLFGQALPSLAKRLNPRALVVDVTAGFGRTIDTVHGPRVTDLFEEGLGREPFRKSPGFEGRERPVLIHEYQWWTSLPKRQEKERYRGLPYQPRAIETMERAAVANGFSDQLDRFIAISIKLKYALRKEGLEYARRLKGCSGYHQWLIQDFYDYCPEGVFNAFWEPPEDLPAAEFRTYNDDTVVLLEDRGTFCVRGGETLALPVLVSHYGSAPIEGGRLAWRVSVEGRELFVGAAEAVDVACGELKQVASVAGTLPEYDRGVVLEIMAELTGPGGGGINSNRWSLWAFPKPVLEPAERTVLTDIEPVRAAWPGMGALEGGAPVGQDVALIVVGALGPERLAYLEGGGAVLLISKGVLPEARGQYGTLFRTVPFNGDRVGNMGTVIEPHPALEGFPHEGWCSFQFFHLISGVYPLDLSAYAPHRIRPIIRSIGHHWTMLDKAYLFEARVGAGTLLATSLDLAAGLGSRPESDFLMAALIRHALKGKGAAANVLPREVLEGAIRKAETDRQKP